MKCPHCSISFHDNHDLAVVQHRGTATPVAGATGRTYWCYRVSHCPSCRDYTIEFGPRDYANDTDHGKWMQIYPIGSNRGPIPPEVPQPIATDYIEAARVLPISPKASAALARRCLQNILHEQGYRARDLAKEIDLLLNEPDPIKALPYRLRATIDGVRNFGNFSAHPIDDKTTLQIIDVEPDEAEWCLDIIDEFFEHFYVGPAAAAAKKAALDAKLTAAGKPPSK